MLPARPWTCRKLPRHDDFAATLGPRALRSPKRACASKTESQRPVEALLRSAESKAVE